MQEATKNQDTLARSLVPEIPQTVAGQTFRNLGGGNTMGFDVGKLGNRVGFSVGRFFFDREKVIEAIGKKEAKFLRHAGNYTKKVAKNSIKTKRKKKKELTAEERQRYEEQLLAWKIAGSPKGQRPKPPITDEVSRPGRPPWSKTGLLKDHIYAVADMTTRSATVGPALLNGTSGEAPAALEFGGTVFSERFKAAINIRPRPFMFPALRASQGKFPEMLRKAFTG